MSSSNPLPAIQNQNDAINVLVSAVQVAQRRGAFSLPEAEVISIAVKQFSSKKAESSDAVSGDAVQQENNVEIDQSVEDDNVLTI